MFKIIILTVALFTTLIWLNIYLIRFIIKKAIQNFIKPKLEGEGRTYTDYKWLGFFNRGDFEDDNIVLVPSLKAGNPIISTYIDVYYLEAAVEKRFTVRIDSSFVSILKVVYSK